MLSWLPFYLVRERGFTTTEMGQITGAAYAINSLSAVAAGWVLDRLIKAGRSPNVVYKTTMVATHAAAVACMVCMAAGAREVALSAMFIYQITCGVQSPGVYAIPQILAGPRATGRWVGIHNSIGALAGVVSPAATGFIIASTHQFTAAFLLAGAVSLLGIVGWWWMLPKLEELELGGAGGAGVPSAGGRRPADRLKFPASSMSHKESAL